MNAPRTDHRSRPAMIAAAATLCLAAFTASPSAAGQPERVVSLGGAVTEIVYALGEQDRIVAVDTTSIYPEQATELPNVGYVRQLAAEGVLALDPDLILAIDGAGPASAVEVLKAGAVPFVDVPEAFSAEGVLQKVTVVGDALGVPDKAEALKAEIAADFKATAEAVSRAEEKPGVLFLLSAGSGRVLAAGSNSAADAAITLAGARNVFADFEGYKPVNAEALVAAAPDYILAMKRPGIEPLDDARALSGIELTPAGKNNRFIAVDGQALLGFGPRTAATIRDLARQIGTISE